jgi:hypothetical protein
MANVLSRYEETAAAFRTAFSIGSVVRGEQLIEWAKQHPILTNDLSLDSARKRIAAIRRRLNEGGGSRAWHESERFIVEVVNAKHGVYGVTRLFDYAIQQAGTALERSERGALAPLERSQKMIDGLEREELENEARDFIETYEQQNADLHGSLTKLYRDLRLEDWIKRLMARGYSREEALEVTRGLPSSQRLLGPQEEGGGHASEQ